MPYFKLHDLLLHERVGVATRVAGFIIFLLREMYFLYVHWVSRWWKKEQILNRKNWRVEWSEISFVQPGASRSQVSGRVLTKRDLH